MGEKRVIRLALILTLIFLIGEFSGIAALVAAAKFVRDGRREDAAFVKRAIQ